MTKNLLCLLFLLLALPVAGQEKVRTFEVFKGDTIYYSETQAFDIVNGDTINKMDESGTLQGQWLRTHPDGSFRCSGVYKDGKKEG